MRFEIIIYSKNKIQKFLTEAIAEYEKRLGRYCKISCRVIKKEKEWQRACAECAGGKESEKAFLITPGRETLSSEELAETIDRWESSGISRVRFLVADPDLIRSRDDEKGTCEHIPVFHLSDFVMEEGMSAMILYEQIYRAYRIINNHPYHK